MPYIITRWRPHDRLLAGRYAPSHRLRDGRARGTRDLIAKAAAGCDADRARRSYRHDLWCAGGGHYRVRVHAGECGGQGLVLLLAQPVLLAEDLHLRID